ncbi:hypothetical protein [uncultured Chryseobacterium sp.]|uniref:hypothetical protein n=1 Tax=uncultured Chryseobacterium sp. TaxID=259322 RepID=UPI002628B046|nr:hypothetical protein [uncultured Chryseobacterium sp.]
MFNKIKRIIEEIHIQYEISKERIFAFLPFSETRISLHFVKLIAIPKESTPNRIPICGCFFENKSEFKAIGFANQIIVSIIPPPKNAKNPERNN